MSNENTSLLQDVRESIATTSIVRVDAAGCRISDIMAQLCVMDGVTECDCARENDGEWDVYGIKDGSEFRLRVTCNA
jgi:hypothetical protein